MHSAFGARSVKRLALIYVNGEEWKLDDTSVSFEEVVEIWEDLHNPEKRCHGNPGIDYHDNIDGECGLLFPYEKVKCKDGTRFNVEFWHAA